MMTLFNTRLALLSGASILGLACAAHAAELDLMISDVDGKAGLMQELADRYAADHPDVTINLNIVGYAVIREQLAGPA